MPIMRVAEPSTKTFSIPSTGKGTFVLLRRHGTTQGGTLDWYIEAATYLDDSNNATSISAHEGQVNLDITRENGVANVIVIYFASPYDDALRCCFIPGNPFPPVGEPV